jgi:hypothetical protein
VLSVSAFRQIQVHTADPLVLDHSPFEVETAIAWLRMCDQILAQLIQAGDISMV